MVDLKELIETKKELILFLLSGEKSVYEIKKHVSVGSVRVSQIINELESVGAVSFESDNNEGRKVILNKDKIIVKYATDQFRPDFLFLIPISIVSAIISLFVGTDFLFGTIFAIFTSIAWLIFKLFKIPESKKVFVKMDTKQS